MNRENVSYSGKIVSIGMDVHKQFFAVSAMCEGELVKRCRIPACAESVLSFIGKYFRGAEVRTCYEAGFSGFWLHRKLVGNAIENIVVHPAAVEVEAGNRVKTDKRDSLKLAQQLEAGRLRAIRVPSEEEESRRQLTRTRQQLRKSKTRVMSQIKMKFYQFGLIDWNDKRAISHRMVEEIVGQKELSRELRLAITLLLNEWDCLDVQLKTIKGALEEQAKRDGLEKIYRSVPGFGPLTARILSTELGDMSQFSNVCRLYSFTGLTPGEWSSGEHVRRGRISRQGSSRIRYILIEAAWRAIGEDENLNTVYQRIKARRGGKRAIVGVARRLIGRARAVLKGRCEYEIGHKLAA